MTVAEVRKKYLEFFEKRGHCVIPSASLVPENDPTTLFTGSGMQPLIPYLLGEKHPAGKRLVNSQKCFRSEDIEEVGDNRHTTFFEMLGNWSLGDYFKEEQLSWCFEFFVDHIGLDPRRLCFTVFAGDSENGIPRDTESAEILKGLLEERDIEARVVDTTPALADSGTPFSKGDTTTPQPLLGKEGREATRIFYYDAKKNWWSRSGVPDKMPVGEPGGPDSEVFFDFDPNGKRGLHEAFIGVKLPQSRGSLTPTGGCHPNCDCGRFMEIGNSVFMEYRKGKQSLTFNPLSLTREEDAFEKLPQRNVDFGGGLERITAAANDEPDIFKLDVFEEKIRAWERESGKDYADATFQKAFRIVADHTRAAEMLAADGVTPSNLGQGYVLRRLLRRAILFADRLGIKLPRQFQEEEAKFRKTLDAGLREFEKVTTTPQPLLGKEGRKNEISGKNAFVLFSTYGFPIDMTVDLAREKGIEIDVEEFAREFEKHRAISRAGAKKKFKGGLADTSEMSVRYHTATHLLHQALRGVLGSEVRQKGSNITPERLRFDFAFSRKMTDEEKKKVEDIVNEKIKQNCPVHKVTLPLSEAKQSGALHFFDEKYPEQVLVHYIGDSIETAYSKEFCGGPHVERTGVLGTFKILKEEAVSAGVRRIKAVLSDQ